MTAGDDQGMPGRDWKTIPDDHTKLTCMDDPFCREVAKRAKVHVWNQPRDSLKTTLKIMLKIKKY